MTDRYRIGTPPDLQAEMIRLYARGLTYRQISAQTFWSTTQVRRVMIANGIPPRQHNSGRRQIETETMLERCQLYGLGFSLYEVAKMTNCCTTSVKATLVRAGVPRRSRREAALLAYKTGRKQSPPGRKA